MVNKKILIFSFIGLLIFVSGCQPTRLPNYCILNGLGDQGCSPNRLVNYCENESLLCANLYEYFCSPVNNLCALSPASPHITVDLHCIPCPYGCAISSCRPQPVLNPGVLRPDLVIENFSASYVSLENPILVRIAAVIKNNGTGIANPSVANLSILPERVNEVPVPALGWHQRFLATAFIESYVDPSCEQLVEVTADVRNTVSEINEANNEVVRNIDLFGC